MSLDNANPPLNSPFPPIADYGFLSDCETCALVAPSGAIEWLCLPRYDGPSVFGALLDRDAGTFRLGPADTMVPAARRYLPGTNILETTWGTDRGWLIVRDVLLVGPWHDKDERSTTHRRAPDGLRRRPRPAAHDALRERVGRGPDGVRPDLRLRPPLRRVGVRGPGLRRGRRVRGRVGDQAPAHDRPARRLRGLTPARGQHAQRRRHGVRRAGVLRPSRTEDVRRGLRPARQDRRLLAPVARARHVPGSSVAPVPAAVAPSR